MDWFRICLTRHDKISHSHIDLSVFCVCSKEAIYFYEFHMLIINHLLQFHNSTTYCAFNQLPLTYHNVTLTFSQVDFIAAVMRNSRKAINRTNKILRILICIPIFLLIREIFFSSDDEDARKCFHRPTNGSAAASKYLVDLLDSEKQPLLGQSIFFVDSSCSLDGAGFLDARLVKIFYNIEKKTNNLNF